MASGTKFESFFFFLRVDFSFNEYYRHKIQINLKPQTKYQTFKCETKKKQSELKKNDLRIYFVWGYIRTVDYVVKKI